MKIAIIPARGGSKRVKKKNIKLFEGIPAIGRVITILSKSKIFDIIIVSTDSSEIMKIAKKYKAEVPFRRPKNISGDHSSTHAVIKHCIKWLENKNVNVAFIQESFCTKKNVQKFANDWNGKIYHSLTNSNHIG